MSILKAKDNTHTDYYTYSIQNWSQPTLPSDGTVVDNFSALNYYHAFLPNTTYLTIYRNENRGWVEVYMYSPTGLIPKSFSFYVQNRTDASSKAYNTAFYGTNEDWVMQTPIPSGCNNSTRNGINTGDWAAAWTNLGTAGTVNESTTGTINMSSNTQYYKWLRFECSTYGTANNDRLTIKNLQLTADQRVVINGTPSNYDFSIDKHLCSTYHIDLGTKPSSNYNIRDTLRRGLVTDTITYKETSSALTFTSSAIGNLNTVTVNTAKAFNPTGGVKRVRPLYATLMPTTVSSQWNNRCCLLAWHASSSGSLYSGGSWYNTAWSSTFDGSSKNVTISGQTITVPKSVSWTDAPFDYWWGFTPKGFGWQSGTQTLAGTLQNVVWEVENDDTTVPNVKYYMFT